MPCVKSSPRKSGSLFLLPPVPSGSRSQLLAIRVSSEVQELSREDRGQAQSDHHENGPRHGGETGFDPATQRRQAAERPTEQPSRGGVTEQAEPAHRDGIGFRRPRPITHRREIVRAGPVEDRGAGIHHGPQAPSEEGLGRPFPGFRRPAGVWVRKGSRHASVLPSYSFWPVLPPIRNDATVKPV